jgi:glutamate 5-kinase
MIRRITVKLGSNVITDGRGYPDEALIGDIVEEIRLLRQRGVQVILVSSGAVAAGRSMLKTTKKLDTVAERQLLSSLGQPRLLQLYSDLFRKADMLCAQVLVTKEDFRDRSHYLNMQNCLNALLQNGIVPVVNENDVVSVTELMFTDNDELAGLISAMLNTDALYILTNVDGVYDGNPNLEGTRLIQEFHRDSIQIEQVASRGTSSFGRGGIITKCHTALRVSKMGIPVVIANGREPGVIGRLDGGERLGTLFPALRSTSSLKKWIAHSRSEVKGEVVINQGAHLKLLSDRATSLLPVGVMEVRGGFKKGDVIRILDESGRELGLGLARYGREKAEDLLGQKNQKALVHYDHLFLH